MRSISGGRCLTIGSKLVMAASGNYKRNDIPEESVFIPAALKPNQTADQMWAELAKLKT